MAKMMQVNDDLHRVIKLLCAETGDKMHEFVSTACWNELARHGFHKPKIEIQRDIK